MSFDDVLVGRPEAEEICPDEGKIPFPGGSGKQKQYCQQQGYIVTMLQASKLHRQQRLQDYMDYKAVNIETYASQPVGPKGA